MNSEANIAAHLPVGANDSITFLELLNQICLFEKFYEGYL